MRRPVILAGSARIDDIFVKDTLTLFDETGGNTGNLAFRYGLASHTKDVLFSHWNAPAADIRAAADILLLPLANQLGAHTDLGHLADRIVLDALIGTPFEPLAVLINVQEFTKTANCWGVSNNDSGTNTNRIVVARRL